MKTVRQILAIIQKTDCAEYMLDGWNYSQPIPTLDEDGKLVDNFFMFSQDIKDTFIYIPYVVFGIYAEEEKTAYKKVFSETNKYTIDYNIDRSMISEAYDRYKELYPEVRECAFKELNAEQKQKVEELLCCLEVIAGPIEMNYYHEFFPSFFEWAGKC